MKQDISSKKTLIEQVRDAANSEKNRTRGLLRPAANFAMEEPIAWTRIFGFDANRYLTDPEFYFEQTLRQKLWRWENFPDEDLPIAPDLPAWLGHYPEYTFVGLDVSFNSRGVPDIQTDHPLTRDPKVGLLNPVDFKTSGWMSRVLRWYDDLVKISAGRINVPFNMTWTRGCLDLAIALRGYENFVSDTVERPQFVHDLFTFLVEQRCRWWEDYYRHFGLKPEPVGISDDWINIPFISPEMFADFVLPQYLEIERFHGGLPKVHSCGNQTPVQKYLLQIRSLSTLEVSPWTDLTQTLANVPPEKHLAVALHPNDVLCATSEQMEAKLRLVADSCRDRSYGIGTSGLTPLTEDISEFVSKINTWTSVVKKVLNQSKS